MSVASRSSRVIRLSATALLFFAALLTVGSIYFTAHFLVSIFGNSVHSNFHWYIGVTLALAMSAWEFAIGSNFLSPSFWPFLFEVPHLLKEKGRGAQGVSHLVTLLVMVGMVATTIVVYGFDFFTTYHGLGIDNCYVAVCITALQVIFPELCVTLHGLTRWNAKISKRAEQDMEKQLNQLAYRVADEDRQHMQRALTRGRRVRPKDRNRKRAAQTQRNGRGEWSERKSLR